LEQLGQQQRLDPLVSLLTLAVRPEAQIQSATQQILGSRPNLFETVVSILMGRLPLLTRKDIMEIDTIPAKDLCHTSTAQEWIAEGEAAGRSRVRSRCRSSPSEPTLLLLDLLYQLQHPGPAVGAAGDAHRGASGFQQPC
jgi:hypothetical protein